MNCKARAIISSIRRKFQKNTQIKISKTKRKVKNPRIYDDRKAVKVYLKQWKNLSRPLCNLASLVREKRGRIKKETEGYKMNFDD